MAIANLALARGLDRRRSWRWASTRIRPGPWGSSRERAQKGRRRIAAAEPRYAIVRACAWMRGRISP